MSRTQINVYQVLPGKDKEPFFLAENQNRPGETLRHWNYDRFAEMVGTRYPPSRTDYTSQEAQRDQPQGEVWFLFDRADMACFNNLIARNHGKAHVSEIVLMEGKARKLTVGIPRSKEAIYSEMVEKGLTH